MQSTPMIIHTLTIPVWNTFTAAHTIPTRSPHIPIRLTRKEKVTSPAPRNIPLDMTKKAKKISVTAATNKVFVPSATTPASLLKSSMKRYVTKNHPDATIVGIRKSILAYELTLDSGHLLKFTLPGTHSSTTQPSD